MPIDMARLARLERERQRTERQARLGYPDAKRKLKIIRDALDRARNGERVSVKPVIRIASEIPDEIQRYPQARTWTWRWWK